MKQVRMEFFYSNRHNFSMDKFMSEKMNEYMNVSHISVCMTEVSFILAFSYLNIT